MLVADILRSKGSGVKTIRADDSAQVLAERLKHEVVGALVVTSDGHTIEGIVSERDLAYGLAEHGTDLSRRLVSELMSRTVHTCRPRDMITDVMTTMTQRRIRHLPVTDGGKLVGLVSIGDVLKHRLGEMELEANVLRDYAIARR